MSESSGYTVGSLAAASGVTVRTLHHYDRIGLLVPSERSAAGYRRYTSDDVVRLGHIVAYRACGLGLTQIASLLDGDDRAEHLRRQVALLATRRDEIDAQLSVLRRTLEADAMGINLDPEEILEVFGEHDPTQYAQEARDRWGETDAYRESHRRTSSYTKADWARLGEEKAEIESGFVACLDAGVESADPRAKELAERHRQHIDRWFYPCSYEMQVGLADMYVADPRFTAHYDDQRPGLAEYVRDAIYANALDQ